MSDSEETSTIWDPISSLGRIIPPSDFVLDSSHAVAFLTNEEELTAKTFTTSVNTTNSNTYVKFIFLQTSPLIRMSSPILAHLFTMLMAKQAYYRFIFCFKL